MYTSNEDDLIVGIFICLVTAILFFFIMFLVIKLSTLKEEAIAREYALYCPNDGNWSWVGECEKDD